MRISLLYQLELLQGGDNFFNTKLTVWLAFVGPRKTQIQERRGNMQSQYLLHALPWDRVATFWQNWAVETFTLFIWVHRYHGFPLYWHWMQFFPSIKVENSCADEKKCPQSLHWHSGGQKMSKTLIWAEASFNVFTGSSSRMEPDIDGSIRAGGRYTPPWLWLTWPRDKAARRTRHRAACPCPVLAQHPAAPEGPSQLHGPL